MEQPLVVDFTAVYSFLQQLKEHEYPVQGNPNYAGLMDVLGEQLPEAEFVPRVALVAVSFESEGQDRFCTFLEKQLGFTVDATDYRDAFILPNKESPYQRLSTKLTYLAGLLAHRSSHIVAVTDAFDVYYPLLDLVENRNCSATIAFFRSGMESRWQRVGLFADESPIRFLDLEPYGKPIVGVDLAPKGDDNASRRGLGNLKL